MRGKWYEDFDETKTSLIDQKEQSQLRSRKKKLKKKALPNHGGDNKRDVEETKTQKKGRLKEGETRGR